MTTIGILGGTGAHGRGPARRFAQAGHEAVIGSRKAERAQVVAATYEGVRGGSDADAAAAEPGVVTVPYQGHAARLRNAGQVEALAANLIAINRCYRVHAGIKITDPR
jgi:8-hydroxy-5-deazaflavin:NADPH oxidoreductase